MTVSRTIDQTVLEVASESATVARDLGAVAASAANTTSGAGQIDEASSELAKMAVQLQTLVSKFRFDGGGRSGERQRRGGPPAPRPASAAHGPAHDSNGAAGHR